VLKKKNVKTYWKFYQNLVFNKKIAALILENIGIFTKQKMKLE